MSLVNDVLKDLQSRQAAGAHPLAGLQPAVRAQRTPPWRVAAGGVLVVVLATTAWALDAAGRPPVSKPGTSPNIPPKAQILSTDLAPGPVSEPATIATVDPSPGAVRTLRLATVTDFSGSRRATTHVPRGTSADTSGKREPAAVAQTPAPAVRPADVSAPAVTPPADEGQASGGRAPESALAEETGAPRVIVRRADGASAADRALRRGVASLAAGDVQGALSALTTAVDLAPSVTDGWRRLAGAYLETGRVDAAVTVLRNGVASASEPNDLRLMLARVLVDADRNAAALSVLEADVASPVLQPVLAAFRAAVLQREGRHDESAALYETLVALRPEEGAWWVGLGISRETLGDTETALAAYRRAAAIAPTPPSLARYAGQRIAHLQSRSH